MDDQVGRCRAARSTPAPAARVKRSRSTATRAKPFPCLGSVEEASKNTAGQYHPRPALHQPRRRTRHWMFIWDLVFITSVYYHSELLWYLVKIERDWNIKCHILSSFHYDVDYLYSLYTQHAVTNLYIHGLSRDKYTGHIYLLRIMVQGNTLCITLHRKP